MTIPRALRRYRQHRNNALRRGIAFQFTFDSWIAWWRKNLGPRWLDRRGRGKNKFCMARKNDEGSYHPRNVKCVTFSWNSHDREWLFTDPAYRAQMRAASAKSSGSTGHPTSTKQKAAVAASNRRRARQVRMKCR